MAVTNLLFNVFLALAKLVFTILHLIYSSLQYFHLNWIFFKRKWVEAFVLRGVDSELYVSRFVTGLKETPHHLGVIIGDDVVGSEDFTNIILWCIAAGISFITVYDQKGALKRQEEKLHQYFNAHSKLEKIQVVFKNIGENRTGRNGFTRKVVVNVLSEVDGKERFVEVLQDAAVQIKRGELAKDSMTLEWMTEEMTSRSGVPDPEVAIVSSSEMCTYGFPPWQIRLTEFIKVSSLQGMNPFEFCEVLHKYSRCEKRVGR